MQKRTITIMVTGLIVALLVGLALTAVQRIRDAAERSRTGNDMRLLATAFFNYAGAYRDLLPSAVAYTTKAGEPGLSWRVALLPYLMADPLYREIHYDESWDSEHNITRLTVMPPFPPSPNHPPGHTRFKVFTGPDTLFPHDGPAHLPTALHDDAADTILLHQSGPPVPWTKPEDTPYDAAEPLPDLTGPYADGLFVGLADASVRFVRTTVSEQTMRAAITPAGGEVLGDDW